MYVYLQCSNCGRQRRLSNKHLRYTADVINQGWGSYGSALYCPKCSKTWDERNPGRPMAGDVNTFHVVTAIFKRAMDARACL